jgi:hypothetical protein
VVSPDTPADRGGYRASDAMCDRLHVMMRTTLLLLALTTATASADTVEFGAAQLTTPEDGWSVQMEKGMMTLGLEAGGAFVEVYDFSKVPAADRADLAKLVGGRKETTAVVIEDAAAHAQHGKKGISFRGTAEIRGKSVGFSAVALDGFNRRAVLAISFWRSDLTAAKRKETTAIVASLRAR